MNRLYRLIMQVDVYPPTTSPSSSADLSFPLLHEPTTLHPITSSTSHQHDLSPTTPPPHLRRLPTKPHHPQLHLWKIFTPSRDSRTTAWALQHRAQNTRPRAVSAPIQRRDFRSVAVSRRRYDIARPKRPGPDVRAEKRRTSDSGPPTT